MIIVISNFQGLKFLKKNAIKLLIHVYLISNMKIRIFIAFTIFLIIQCSRSGCIDEKALNFDTKARKNDGKCVYIGCNDPTAYNYNPISTVADVECIYEGCTDTNAANYNPNATVSSLCIYNHIGSWAAIKEEFYDSIFTTINGVIYDYLEIPQTANTPLNQIDPFQLNFLQNRAIQSSYLDGSNFNGNWSISNNNLNFELKDTILTMQIDTVNSNMLRLVSNSTSYVVIDSVTSIRKIRRTVLEYSRN
tara:strand:+ start:2199 stop:2945 length:747 start_codon:yes stop_codon:yes gene_type:complete